MGNVSELKRRNLLEIIKTIRQNGLMTKPEIAALSALTSVSVHNFIAELIDKKMVLENGSAGSNGGRKAVLYKINAGFGHIIGQNLSVDSVDTNIFDLDLNLLYKNRIVYDLSYSEKVIDVICQQITMGVDSLGLKFEDCLGIGVSMPGQVEHVNGVVINLTNIPGWKNIPLKTLYQTKFGVPASVENDSNSSALAVKWLKIVGEKSDMVFVSFSSGVGTGILTKGKLLHGSHSNVGEIGHTTINYNGPKCACGNRGCIEVYAGDLTILKRVKQLRNIKIDFKNDLEADIKTLIKMAQEGEPKIYEIFKETAGFISIAIDHIIKSYGPEVIVVQNHWLKEFQDLSYYMIDNVFARCTWINRDSLRIMLNDIENVEGIGAATLILEEIFRYSDENLLLKKLAI